MQKVIKIIKYMIIFLICLIICSIGWAFTAYDKITFDEVLFHLNPNLAKSGFKVLLDYFIKGFIPTILLFVLVLYAIKYVNNFITGYELHVKIKIHNKIFKHKFDEKVSRKILNSFIYIILIFILIFSLYKLEFFSYIKSQMQKSTFIENNYVDPKKVKLEFPLEKRNLIYIFVESLESSYLSKDLGGLKDENLLSNLSGLMDENINFSNSDTYGGAIQVEGLWWTAAGMIAQTAGIPLKVPGFISNESHFKKYLVGAYSLGDILNKEGYNQELLLGSNASFGNRDIYFKSHGNYKIYDYETAIKNKKIAKDYYQNWGFEDSKLFDIAKEEVLKLHKKGEPFNFTTLTTATHFPDGFVEKTCETKYDDSYSNAIDCSSMQIIDFVNWVKEQDFYDNTTIVIAGDHLTMQADFFDNADFENRTVFNLFINSLLEDSNSKNRLFTTMDLYPTTLASLGVKIEGERLGLGVNLYSGEQTIIEKYGRKKVNDEISKVSKFYNEKILK